MYVTGPMGFFPCAIKSMAYTTFTCDAPFVYASDTSVSILRVQFVLCHCKSGKWQGLTSVYSEDTKSVVETADPEGPGMLLGRSNMSLNSLM